MLSFLCLLLLNLLNAFQIDLSLKRSSHAYTDEEDELKMYIDNDFLYLIPVCLGTPPQCFQVLYEVNFTHLLINQQFLNKKPRFHISQSSTAKNLSSYIEFDKVQSDAFNDNLYFDCFTSPFDWLYGTKILGVQSFYDGKFGFGRNYDNSSEKYHEKYSIVHKLYNLGKINKKIFGHKYFHDRKYVRLYIGEINLEEFNQNKNYPKCYVENTTKRLSTINDDFNHLWACDLKKVRIQIKKDNEISDEPGYEIIPKINNSVVFSTVTNEISGPFEQGKQFIDFLLSYPTVNATCKKHLYGRESDHLSIVCKWTSDIYQFPTIYFELEGVELTLHPKNYIYKEYDMTLEDFVYKGRFQFTPMDSYWTIGQSVLREYDMIFDMEEGSVGFWNISKEPEKSDFIFIKIVGFFWGGGKE